MNTFNSIKLIMELNPQKKRGGTRTIGVIPEREMLSFIYCQLRL